MNGKPDTPSFEMYEDGRFNSYENMSPANIQSRISQPISEHQSVQSGSHNSQIYSYNTGGYA